MTLIGYNISMQYLGEIPCLNLQWNRKYYEYGDFEAQILLSDFNQNIKFVMVDGRSEVGQVQKIETKHEVKGDFVLLSGHFMEEYLSVGSIVSFSRENTQPAQIAIDALNYSFLHGTIGIPISGWGAGVNQNIPYGTATSAKWDCDSLGDALASLLKTEEMAQSTDADFNQHKVIYRVWRGTDRTGSVIFQQDSPYVLSMSVTRDETSYCNLCIVIKGTAESPSSEMHWRNGVVPSGEQIRAFFLDVRAETEKTDEELEQQIKEAFDENNTAYDINISVLQGQGCDYITHYNLGDKCRVVDSRVSLDLSARIVEIREVWKAGKHEVSIVFGNQKKTVYKAYNKAWWWM